MKKQITLLALILIASLTFIHAQIIWDEDTTTIVLKETGISPADYPKTFEEPMQKNPEKTNLLIPIIVVVVIISILVFVYLYNKSPKKKRKTSKRSKKR